MRREIPDVEFRIYGAVTDETYYQQCLERVAALDLQRTVVFCGSTNQPSDAYRRADVVVLASVSEGFPFALIEAMLCRRPVVATDVGGVCEAVGEAGVLVPPRDAPVLASVLSALLRRPEERERLAERASARARALFTEERFISAYADSYHTLVAERGGRTTRVAVSAA